MYSYNALLFVCSSERLQRENDEKIAEEERIVRELEEIAAEKERKQLEYEEKEAEKVRQKRELDERIFAIELAKREEEDYSQLLFDMPKVGLRKNRFKMDTEVELTEQNDKIYKHLTKTKYDSPIQMQHPYWY